jgi:hypothetical protein
MVRAGRADRYTMHTLSATVSAWMEMLCDAT